MDDAVKVEVEVIEFDIVGIRGCDVERDCYAVYFFGRLFDDSGHYFGIFFTEPAKGCRDTTNYAMYFLRGKCTPYLRVTKRNPSVRTGC